MEKFSDYKILRAQDPEELSAQVKQHLQDGWLLLGAPFSHNAEGENWLCQAMIRQEDARPGSIGFNRP